MADYFDPFSLVSGEEPVRDVPDDYYITTAFSDSAVAYVNRYAQGDRPFFLYLSYTAPHWPLHALPEDIALYEDTYRVGWDSIRAQRYGRMEQLGILADAGHALSPRPFDWRWEDNPDREWDARAMAVHAAMVHRMDRGIGQLVEALKANGQYDNTLILFLSDNGCSPEVCQNFAPGENDRPDRTRDGREIIYPKNKEALPGPETTFASLGAEGQRGQHPLPLLEGARIRGWHLHPAYRPLAAGHRAARRQHHRRAGARDGHHGHLHRLGRCHVSG